VFLPTNVNKNGIGAINSAYSIVQLVCKPASVKLFLLQEKLKPFPSFILILHRCRIHTTYPPASDEQPLPPVYMVFQLIMRTAPDVTTRAGELLPHLFTLSPLSEAKEGGYFLLHFNTLTDIFPLGSMTLCVDRTFLPDIPITIRTGRWNNLLPFKGSHSLTKDQNIS
jgi:hypothetical protein